MRRLLESDTSSGHSSVWPSYKEQDIRSTMSGKHFTLFTHIFAPNGWSVLDEL